MAKKMFFIIDGLTKENAGSLRTSLNTIDAIKNFKIDPTSGTLSIIAKRDVEKEVEVACSIAQCSVRTKTKRNPF